jgi:hypothetical protein
MALCIGVSQSTSSYLKIIVSTGSIQDTKMRITKVLPHRHAQTSAFSIPHAASPLFRLSNKGSRSCSVSSVLPSALVEWVRLSLDSGGPLRLPGRGGGDIDVHVLGARDFSRRSREDDFDVARVTLVRVDSTVGSVSPSSGFLRDK